MGQEVIKHALNCGLKYIQAEGRFENVLGVFPFGCLLLVWAISYDVVSGSKVEPYQGGGNLNSHHSGCYLSLYRLKG